MSELHIRNLGEVRKALAKAARTDASTADSVVDRFIELMPGLQDKLSAERHQLLTGRRGTGKSTLLFVLRKNLRSKQIPVAILDMEKYNGRDYPDVLIEVLMALLREIQPKVTFKEFFPRLRLKWKMSSLESELGQMLTDPQRLVKKFNRQVNRKRDGGAQVALKGQYSGHGAGASGSVQQTRNDEETTVGEYEEFKIQRLQTIAARISDLLVEVMKASPNGYAVVFLDDYYFVPIKDQPSVLGYLHQICKGTGVWLKVGGVGSRLHPFVDGHPPVGMEPGHDLSVVPLDVTLADFATARRFLEAVLEGVVSPYVTPMELFTGDSRNRMVLACGGAVTRDYITLTEAALDEAVERMSKKGEFHEDAVLKIWTVDIQSAVKKQMNVKEQEAFQRDAESDASALSNRWRDICDFVASTGESFVLVPQAQLERDIWGKEVQQLENLRLIHRIKDTIPKSGAGAGVKTMVFMIDLGQQSNVRLSKKIPEFWSSVAEFDRLRRSSWIYTPDWREKKAKASNLAVTDQASEEEDEPLFDYED